METPLLFDPPGHEIVGAVPDPPTRPGPALAGLEPEKPCDSASEVAHLSYTLYLFSIPTELVIP